MYKNGNEKHHFEHIVRFFKEESKINHSIKKDQWHGF